MSSTSIFDSIKTIPAGTPVILLVEPDLEYVKNAFREEDQFEMGGLYFLRDPVYNVTKVMTLVKNYDANKEPSFLEPFYVEYKENVFLALNEFCNHKFS